MKQLVTAWIGAWLILGGGETARAVVNAEKFQPGKFEEGFSGLLDGTLSLSQGNVDVLDVGGTGRLQYQTRNANTILDQLAEDLKRPEIFGDRLLLLADVRFAERAGASFMNRLFTHLRWTHMYREWIGGELFAQYQFDEFTRLSNRSLAGAGVRIEWIRQEWGHVWAGLGYMAEYETLDLLPGDTTHTPHMLNHRANSYLTASFPIAGEGVTVQNTFYFQPRVDDLDDFRILNELDLIVDISADFAFLATLEVAHDNRPPAGVKKTDTRLRNSLRLKF